MKKVFKATFAIIIFALFILVGGNLIGQTTEKGNENLDSILSTGEQLLRIPSNTLRFIVKERHGENLFVINQNGSVERLSPVYNKEKFNQSDYLLPRLNTDANWTGPVPSPFDDRILDVDVRFVDINDPSEGFGQQYLVISTGSSKVDVFNSNELIVEHNLGNLLTHFRPVGWLSSEIILIELVGEGFDFHLGLYSYDLNTKEIIELLPSPVGYSDYYLAPNGKLILYGVTAGDQMHNHPSEYWLYSMDGATQKKLFNTDEYIPIGWTTENLISGKSDEMSGFFDTIKIFIEKQKYFGVHGCMLNDTPQWREGAFYYPNYS
jgi:hypothetical protein